MIREREVIVRHFPETIAGKQLSDFLLEIKGGLDVDRPCLVLDCSQLIRLDRQIVFVLVVCLEEAMKRNGDVRLAGVSPQARAALKAIDADTLFNFYDTAVDAIASFHRRSKVLPLRSRTQCTNDFAA
jgi:anti-anti-sigma regulatory factor